jgi:hypothetical protein
MSSESIHDWITLISNSIEFLPFQFGHRFVIVSNCQSMNVKRVIVSHLLSCRLYLVMTALLMGFVQSVLESVDEIFARRVL